MYDFFFYIFFFTKGVLNYVRIHRTSLHSYFALMYSLFLCKILVRKNQVMDLYHKRPHTFLHSPSSNNRQKEFRLFHFSNGTKTYGNAPLVDLVP